MQRIHVPGAGVRYWTALSIASVFGANSGDFVAKYLHLGHFRGLLPLAIIFAAIYWAEQRDRSVHQAYYWLAIIVVRTAATNLGDLGASDLAIGKLWLIASLAIILVLTLVISPPLKPADAQGQVFQLPETDAKYWTAMLIAGTLGTVIGDFTSFDSGMGTANASLFQGGILAALFIVGGLGWFANLWFYWLTVVVVRAAGTSFSDFLAHNVFGLPLSALCTGLLFVTILLVWRDQPSHQRISLSEKME